MDEKGEAVGLLRLRRTNGKSVVSNLKLPGRTTWGNPNEAIAWWSSQKIPAVDGKKSQAIIWDGAKTPVNNGRFQPTNCINWWVCRISEPSMVSNSAWMWPFLVMFFLWWPFSKVNVEIRRIFECLFFVVVLGFKLQEIRMRKWKLLRRWAKMMHASLHDLKFHRSLFVKTIFVWTNVLCHWHRSTHTQFAAGNRSPTRHSLLNRQSLGGHWAKNVILPVFQRHYSTAHCDSGMWCAWFFWRLPLFTLLGKNCSKTNVRETKVEEPQRGASAMAEMPRSNIFVDDLAKMRAEMGVWWTQRLVSWRWLQNNKLNNICLVLLCFLPSAEFRCIKSAGRKNIGRWDDLRSDIWIPGTGQAPNWNRLLLWLRCFGDFSHGSWKL